MSISASSVLLVAAPVLPIALVATWLLPPLRVRVAPLLVVAPLPALAAALVAAGGPGVTFWRGLAPITLALDLPGASLLGVSSLLWMAAAAYAAGERRGRQMNSQFATCWLLTLAGNIGVFMAADLASFFLSYALVSIPAYGLVVQDDTPPVRRAGAIYMGYTVLGETILLMGFGLLAVATPGRSLSIHDVLTALPGSPWRGATIALLIASFGMKIGLLPLHVWMPLTYRAAPIPAAAVLSGAAVKAGVIGLIRFLPLGTVMPAAGLALAGLGLAGAFYGVAVGLTQSNPKTILAYSSISQMGLISTALGMGLVTGDASVGSAAAFYGAHHVLVKGALFLAVGLAAATTSRRTSLVLLPALVLALGLGGLPLTGGSLAKLAVKASLGKGLVAGLSSLSAAASTLLMLHFALRLKVEPVSGESRAAPRWLIAPWLMLAVASVAVPWVLYPVATGGFRSEALAPAALWASLWPVLLGALMAGVFYQTRDRVPRVPEGDILVVGKVVARATSRWSEVIERLESELRQWPVASLSLLAIAILLGATMLVGR
jgi:formate hydrogenlyase subunit 3/multisubunit Na+/H+ antiporter MnhD subunit